MTARIGFVSDLHFLSRYGLMPPDWRQARDPLRPIQEYLWACFRDFTTSVPPLDALLIVGDVVEGTKQLRGEPRGSASDDETDQLDACEEGLVPLCKKAKQVYLVAGTPFHDATGGRIEALGDRLKAACPNTTIKRWAGRRYGGQVLNLQWRGLTINASHHNTRGWMWLGGAASRMAVLSAAAEAVRKLPRADIIVRADLHTHLKMETLGKWVVFLPGWTMPNPHAIKRMEAIRAYLATDIGGAVMTVEEDGTIGWMRGLTYPLSRSEVYIA